MNISARNQIEGSIESIQTGAVSAIVTLKSIHNEKITATISVESVKELGLSEGTKATAIVKATEVMIGIGEMKLSARNQFSGTITSIQEGAVNAIVTVETEKGTPISSTISIPAVKDLGLSVGIHAKAIIKATSVMIAV